MARELILRAQAEVDLADAYNWYEDKVPGLGSDFINSVEAALFSIERNPEQHPLVHKSIKRALIRRFPYGIFYLVEQNEIVVLAVFHARRHPNKWKGLN